MTETSDNKNKIVKERKKDTLNIGREKGIKTEVKEIIKTSTSNNDESKTKNSLGNNDIRDNNKLTVKHTNKKHSKNNKLNNKKDDEYNNILSKNSNISGKKHLKEAKLSGDDIDLGIDDIKSGYNALIKTKHIATNTIKTGKMIKKTPHTIKQSAKTIKNIPTGIKTMVKRRKATVVKSVKKVRSIGDKIIKGNFKEAGKQITKNSGIIIKDVSKKSFKAVKPSIKFGTYTSKSGLKKLNSSLKNEFIKSEGTDDIGAKTIDTMVSTSKASAIIGNNLKKDISITKKAIEKKLKTGKTKREIKTLKRKKDIAKSSYDGIKYTLKKSKKLAKTLASKIKAITFNFVKLIFKNPVVAAIIGLIIVGIIVLEMLISTIIGVHGASTIDFISDDNIAKWKVQMEKIDTTTYKRIHSGSRLRVINPNSSVTWKELMAVYYVKYQDMNLVNNSTISDGSSVNTVNPEAWNQIYEELQSHLGEAYVYGGSSPETGFDCSGIVQYCFSVAGIDLPRTTYEQCEVGGDVNNDDMQPGDLVFFMGSDPQDGLPGHVGVYIGDGQYIHAPRTGDVIKISDLSARSDLWGVRRVITASDDSQSSDNPNSSSSGSNTDLSNSMDGTYADLFTKVGNEYNIDPILLASIAMQESSLDPNCVSSAGACGLCQMMPETFTDLGFSLDDIFDPYTNCCACAMELNDLATRHSDLTELLSCYNAGEQGYKNQIANGGLCSETANYANGVYKYYQQFSNGGLPTGAIGGVIGAGNSVSKDLQNIYNLFNEVQRKSSKKHVTYILTKHDLSYVEDKLNMSQEDRDWVAEILDYDNFEYFGNDYDFRFKLT